MNRYFIPLLIVAACTQTPSSPDEGKIDGRIYRNEYYGLSLEIPEPWIIHNEKEKASLSEAGKDQLEEVDSTLARKVDSAQEKVLQLLSVFQNKVGSSDDFNPSFIVMSERLPGELEAMNEPAYLQVTKKQLEQTGLYQTFEQLTEPVAIDGENFFMLRVSSRQRDVVNQEFYARIKNGYALIIILSYTDATQKENLHELLRSINFD